MSKITTSVEVQAPVEDVWKVITNIQDAGNVISGILDINILHQPQDNLVGLKWEETRMMFGKEATETMWITEAKENEFYLTRAESHGCIYITKVGVTPSGTQTKLSYEFEGQAQSFFAKLMGFFLNPIMKKTVIKLFKKDLEEIKRHVESNQKEDNT